MRFFVIGDVMGRGGRQALKELLPLVRERFDPDVIVANGENVAGGFGINEKTFAELTDELGIDVITMGNHWMDKKDIYRLLERTNRIVLPANMANVQSEEMGIKILSDRHGRKFAVMNLIGVVFMKGPNRPLLETADRIVSKLPADVAVRLVDVHAEASSEKQAVGRLLAGRASLVYGTHSHVQTADERILPKGTGFITDVGMTGSYDSVIGIRTDAVIRRFMTGEKKNFEPAEGDPWLCAVVVDVDPETGRCVRLERIRWEVEQMKESSAQLDLVSEGIPQLV